MLVYSPANQTSHSEDERDQGSNVSDSTKASSSNLTQPHVPPLNSPAIEAEVVLASAEPHQPVTASTVQEISTASSSHSAQTHVPPSVPPVADPPAEADTRAERQPVKPTERRASDLTSQRLWNAAYDNLENDENTAKLVKSYVEILAGVLETTGAADTSISTTDDNSIELKDPIKRQTYMRKLVEEGRKKIATTSKITEGGGNVVGYIEKAKGMIDAAIGNIPQAALPWAGVCVGLQILSNPGTATKSNLAGIAHVISRMRDMDSIELCLFHI
ncbi:hypothetical protein BDZ45DRAFT_687628 [Acephala macrosclerotiorum]|nr:hypothetical protein BDZ45DRAFT_687628 [Acephala macrosclerotiorum]